MNRKTAKPKRSALTIQNCTLTRNPFQVTPDFASAVKAIAEAATANAKAIERLATIVGGTQDNGSMITVNGVE
jgi:hypothetical protein